MAYAAIRRKGVGMKQDTTLTHIDYEAIKRVAHRLRNQEIGRISALVAASVARSAISVATWARQRVQRMTMPQSR
jgi:hypothetical protein